MKSDKNQPFESADLRHRAELILKALAPAEDSPESDGEAQRLFHELQVHQVELEMQNAELRQARDEMEKSLEKYTDLYDFAPVGYVSLDRDGTIGAANLTVAMLLGVDRSRLIGQRFERFVVAELRPTFTGFLDRVFTSQGKEACELALLNDGVIAHFAQIEAVAASSREECRAAIVDISVRRQLEEKLVILHKELASRATDLEAANVELEAFNYSVSHDLRGPLTVIAGYCDVVEDLYGSKLDKRFREYIQTIYKGTMSMSRLIDTLLRFSFVKRVEIRHEQVDLSKLAEDVAMNLKVADPERRSTFRIAAGVVADGVARLLRVVLDNLIGNAWKYSGKTEEAVIEFGVREVDGKPAYYLRDNGPGFDMAQAEKLFMPFQRLPGTDVEGHGIGLATVDRIVRRHGGKVWTESKPGEGATFWFTLA